MLLPLQEAGRVCTCFRVRDVTLLLCPLVLPLFRCCSAVAAHHPYLLPAHLPCMTPSTIFLPFLHPPGLEMAPGLSCGRMLRF